MNGQTLAVTAPAFPHYGLDNIGSLFLYRKSGSDWILDQTLVPDTSAVTSVGFRFGYSAHFAGEELLVAADRSTQGGVVFVYRPDTTGQYQLVDALTPPPGVESDYRFGGVMASRGDTLAIAGGTPTDVEGRVHVFRRSGVGAPWVAEEVLQGSVPPNNGFNPDIKSGLGSAIEILDDRILVGDPNSVSPAAYGSGSIAEFRLGANGQYVMPEQRIYVVTGPHVNTATNIGVQLFAERGLMFATGGTPGGTYVGIGYRMFSTEESDTICPGGGQDVARIRSHSWVSTADGHPRNDSEPGLVITGLPGGSRVLVMGALGFDAANPISSLGAFGLCLDSSATLLGSVFVDPAKNSAYLFADGMSPAWRRLAPVVDSVAVQALYAAPNMARTWSAAQMVQLD